MDIASAQAAEISDIHALLRSNDPALVEHRRLLGQLSALKGLPQESPICFLGYFALLESLLTHPPKPTDPYDSITIQIKKKLALLNRRLLRPIDYSPFGDASPETVWAKMYDCRSKVAHGGVPDFGKDLRLLKSQDHALKLVKETAKAVITHALREPRLLIDLREC